MKHLGIISLLIGAAILIYRGLLGNPQSNTLLGIGLLLVLVGFLAHIIINRANNKEA